MTRVLVFSSLFPNAAQPNHGVFVENRLQETLKLGGVDALVVAPVPYFPFSQRVFGRYGDFARAPRWEMRRGVQVWHPRYLAAPKTNGRWTPAAMVRAALPCIRRLQEAGWEFNVIDAHYFYPDGVAAARIGQLLRLPVVITARGTDLTLIPSDRQARARITWAAQEASATVAVCEDLRHRLLELGAASKRCVVLRNGVDLDSFRPADAPARRVANLPGFILLTVGALIPRKGVDLVIEALSHRPDCSLLVAGDGPERGRLEAQASRLGVADRVRFLGAVPHADLCAVYNAADVLVLASSREGWANVLLEAMACGTPVIATDVNGTREVVRSQAAGRLVRDRTVDGLLAGLDDLRRAPPIRRGTVAYAERFGWSAVARANKALLGKVADAGFAGRHAVDFEDLQGLLEASRGDVGSPASALMERRLG